MTNFEKFSNDIDTTNFAVINGNPVNCFCVYCGECEFWEGRDIKYHEEICNKKRMEWLKAEYEGSKKINIPKDTPIDTQVLVSDGGVNWYRRHYAGNMNETHYVWNNGKTSWTSEPKQKTSWEYMKLYKKGERTGLCS